MPNLVSQKINYISRTFLRSIGAFICLLLFLLVIQGFIALIAFVFTKNINSANQLFLEHLSPIFASSIIIFWAKKRNPGIFNRILNSINFDKKNIKLFIIYTLLSLFILYLSFSISILLGYSNFVYFGYNKFPVYKIFYKFFLVGLLSNLFVATGEEIIFRGFLLNYIIGISRNKLFGLLFTSFIFSLHHYPDLLNNVIAFLGGLAMGYAYLKFETLYIPIGIHFAYNIFNASIASETLNGPQLPYLVKINYPMILNGFGAWVDLFIIASFLILLTILWIKKVPTFIHRAIQIEL